MYGTLCSKTAVAEENKQCCQLTLSEQLSHHQNLVLKWSTRNHAKIQKQTKKAAAAIYGWDCPLLTFIFPSLIVAQLTTVCVCVCVCIQRPCLFLVSQLLRLNASCRNAGQVHPTPGEKEVSANIKQAVDSCLPACWPQHRSPCLSSKMQSVC